MTDNQPLPAKYAFSLYRGDSRVWEHHFNDAPPDWTASTAYVVGTVGSLTYLANSTVTNDGTKYTCISAHTSGSAFDATKWSADPLALGPPTDITDWVFESSYRVTPDAADTIVVEGCDIIDGPNGIMRRTLIAEQSALLPDPIVAWDLQATKPDESVRTYLYNDKVKVQPDVTR